MHLVKQLYAEQCGNTTICAVRLVDHTAGGLSYL